MEATSIYHKAPERFFKENNYHTIELFANSFIVVAFLL